ncbi:hypothetical protein [Planomonospora sp. ID82291]|uniref:hypothetical protein n=1 Tax=Planomonospora sp. ID82291 TaxID=2738136 RepID=UPI0018C41E24|nr:hypothetical protein [Planomonospora sp. ID82291]MBG0816916.1 hypothetical protein [Planomonospora sp. ID82291]
MATVSGPSSTTSGPSPPPRTGRRGRAYISADPSAASAEDWDAGRFAAEHLSAYLGECAGWAAEDGRIG